MLSHSDRIIKMKLHKTITLVATAALVAMATPLLGLAQSDVETTQRGLEIATEADVRDTGFGDSSAQLRMVLRNRHGEESERLMSNKTLEVNGDGDKSLVVFDQPRDVKGTGFLSFTHKEGQDDQWLYLPSLKRVKRIASNNKSGSFMSSEFAYEDIASQEIEKFTYKYVGEETVDGVDMWVIERYPVDPKSGYTRQVAWYDKGEYRLQKVDFYDRKESLLKTLLYSNYERYMDKYWRALQMDMTNHQTGKSTTLFFSDYEFGVGLTDRDFDTNSLKRAR